MIRVENVSFAYRNTGSILRDISLEIAPGEIHALVGPNGAGKSTLLKIISGDLNASSGTISMFGEPLDKISLRRRAKFRAVMPQKSHAAFPFSVLETVAMGRTPYNDGRLTEIDARLALDALTLVEAHDLAERSYTELSGGEQQRVNLARALAQVYSKDGRQERFLLLDEPTANLDVFRQKMLLQLLRQPELRSLGVFVIIHDINLAARYADRITVLNDNGMVAANGAPWDIVTREIIQEAFKVHANVHPHPEADCPLVII